MLDPRYVRDNPEEVARLLLKKNFNLDIEQMQQLDSERRAVQTQAQNRRADKKRLSRQVGTLIGQGMTPEEARLQVTDQLAELDSELAALESREKELLARWNRFFMSVPNLPEEAVPEGKSEACNVELRRWGTPPRFDFTPADHVDLGAALGLDFNAGAKLSGSRFVVIRNKLARLHRALAQFMLDVQVDEHGYQECYTPYLVQSQALEGTGQLPKFAEDLFRTSTEGQHEPHYLIPTAEVSLTNLVRETVLDAQQLPIKLTAHTPCFRSEAGSYGRDTRGMIRQHQFDKVEMVCITHPSASARTLEDMTTHAEAILQKLELPYRVMALCGGDLGFGAARTYDLEVWLPGQQQYREISSVSNCRDFQARRMQARFRDPETGNPALVHTLNGSGLAVGRTLIAVMENCQDARGCIHIPEALHPYMGGVKVIERQT
ncbi:MAG: serine--tRNA ligase [Kistimonas sp.]|nr:serine--tRNA ligase [Kistimonas sp.]